MGFLGIDYSSTNTGIVYINQNEIKYNLISPQGSFDERIVIILQHIKSFLKAYNITLIAIESPSFMSKGKVVDLAAGYGYIKYTLLADNYSVITIPPSTLKKFATGNGRASKEDMLVNLPQTLSSNFKKYKKYDDLVDAYWLAKYAETYFENNFLPDLSKISKDLNG